MHAFPFRPKASIWDWARTPTGIPMHTGQDLTYMLSNVPSAAVSHDEIEAGSFALTLFRQSGFSAIRLFHSLDMLSQWDSLLLHFAIEWLHHHEHVWAIIQLTLISTYCRLVTQYQAFRISSWPVWACMENLAWKGKWGEQDTGKVLKSLSGDLITCGQHCF